MRESKDWIGYSPHMLTPFYYGILRGIFTQDVWGMSIDFKCAFLLVVF